ncbi:hypothetical protein JZ751_019768 [Albula glossodonta]|uniref:Uncharacterized protein n=1 Tax=Albula glossodonta TaxID=121402 RepID=A0A8T2NKV8_9TELE|nr:hypothetical protein JZ751_019768 [Albula glossodonta]
MRSAGRIGPNVTGPEEHLESDLRKLECHFTWDLKKEDTDLPFLEVKLHDIVSIPLDSENNLKGRAYNYLAYVKHLQGMNDKALDFLNKAVEENVDNAKHRIVTYANLAWVHHLMGNYSKAQGYLKNVEEIKESFSTHPPEILPCEILGEKAWSLLKFSKKHHEEAKECFYEALQRDPDSKEWNTGYAISLFKLEGLRIMGGTKVLISESPAAKQLLKALSLHPDNAIIMVYLGYKYQNNGDKLEAWKYIRKALDTAPCNLSVVLKAAKSFKKVHSYDMALQALNTMLERAPNSSRLHHEIACNYRWKAIREVGNIPRTSQKYPEDYKTFIHLCIYHLEKEVHLNPSYIYPQLELAMRYADIQDLQKATDIFQRIFALPDLRPAEKQSLHRMYGDFQSRHIRSVTNAIEHYKEGMKLQNISSDWKKCRARLIKISALLLTIISLLCMAPKHAK